MANRTGLLPGVDLRGDGGFVVAPPSRHANGQVYTWHLAPETELSRPPDRLLDLLGKPAPVPSPTGFRIPTEIGNGTRNDLLYRLSRTLRQKGLSREAIGAAVRVENAQKCQPPLLEPEVTDLLGHAWEQPDQPGFVFVPTPTESRPNESNDGSQVIGPPLTVRRGPFAPISAADLLG